MVHCPQCHSRNSETSRFCSECGAPLTPTEKMPTHTETIEMSAEKLATGSTFAGRYQVVEELGRGGMGRVYRVLDMKLNEEVAIKLIRPEIASDKKILERFSNELKLARKITHKNVAKMFELMEDAGTHFITMEYVPGEDLRRMIRMSRQLSVATAVSVARQVCEGLAEAHRLGVVHRDLKPANIMIDREGRARILDFGIARTLREKGITGTGMMIGTPEYMSPEQMEGKDVDERSDIYSLGIIIYEMLTGRVPFEGETPFAIGIKHRSELPMNPAALNPQIPEEVSRLVLRCLEKDRAQRFMSTDELFEELTKIEQGVFPPEPAIVKREPVASREITVAFSLKKLVLPAVVAAAAIVLILSVMLIWRHFPRKEAVPVAATERPSIAVLPFEDLSPQKDQGYLCDGLTESLISALTHIQGLRIPARTSSFSFREKERNIREIGQKLSVKALLEGSVQKADNRIRVTAQLINVEDEALIWSEQYSRELNDVFAIQDDITLAIVDKLKVNLMGGEKAKLFKRYTGNVEAYELYLKGRYFWEKRTGEDMENANEYFQKAIQVDSNFALAYAGMADSYATLGWYGFLAREGASEKAREAAKKALQIDGTLSEAYVSLGNVEINFFWDWEAAKKSFERALELNPGNAEAHHQYAHLIAQKGQLEEGIAEMRRALELEPLSVVISSCLGQVLFYARLYDEAIEELEKAIEIDSSYMEPYGSLGMIYVKKGQYEKAIPLLEKGATSQTFKTRMMGAIGYVYALEGKRDEALKMLAKMRALSAKQHVDPCFMAWIRAGLGEKDQAFQLLNQAYEERANWMLMAKVDPFLDSLRSDPRFKGLWRKMELKGLGLIN